MQLSDPNVKQPTKFGKGLFLGVYEEQSKEKQFQRKKIHLEHPLYPKFLFQKPGSPRRTRDHQEPTNGAFSAQKPGLGAFKIKKQKKKEEGKIFLEFKFSLGSVCSHRAKTPLHVGGQRKDFSLFLLGWKTVDAAEEAWEELQGSGSISKWG